MVCVRIVWWTFWRGIVYGSILGAVFGTFILPIVGTIYGFFYGGLIGFVMGAVDAFALGAIAHFFMDMDYPAHIIPWLRLISVILNLVGVSLCMAFLFGVNLFTFEALLYIVPPVLAAIAIFYLCPRFVAFAVRIQTDTPDQPTTALPRTRPEPVR